MLRLWTALVFYAYEVVAVLFTVYSFIYPKLMNAYKLSCVVYCILSARSPCLTPGDLTTSHCNPTPPSVPSHLTPFLSSPSHVTLIPTHLTPMPPQGHLRGRGGASPAAQVVTRTNHFPSLAPTSRVLRVRLPLLPHATLGSLIPPSSLTLPSSLIPLSSLIPPSSLTLPSSLCALDQ